MAVPITTTKVVISDVKSAVRSTVMDWVSSCIKDPVKATNPAVLITSISAVAALSSTGIGIAVVGVVAIMAIYIVGKYNQKDEITTELFKIISNTEQFMTMFKLIELYRETYNFFIDLTDVNKKCLEIVRLFTVFTNEIMPQNDDDKTAIVNELQTFNGDIHDIQESIKSVQTPIASQPEEKVSIITKFIGSAKRSFRIITGKPKQMLIEMQTEFNNLILYFTILLGQTFLQLNMYQYLETYEYNQHKIKEIMNSHVYDKFLLKILLKIFEDMQIFSDKIDDSDDQINNNKFIEILDVCHTQVSLFFKSLKPDNNFYEGTKTLLLEVNKILNDHKVCKGTNDLHRHLKLPDVVCFMSSQDIKNTVMRLKGYLEHSVIANGPPDLLAMMKQDTSRLEKTLSGGKLMIHKNVSRNISKNTRQNRGKKSNSKKRQNRGKKSNSNS